MFFFLNQNIETLDTITFLRNFLLEEPNLKTTHIPLCFAEPLGVQTELSQRGKMLIERTLKKVNVP